MTPIGISLGVGENSLDERYDLVILGAGPAGLTAGIYAARARVNHIILEKNPIPGGQIINTDIVENYPGFPEPVGGFDLMEKFRQQAQNFGAKIITAPVNSLTHENSEVVIDTDEGKTRARAVIIATGADPKKLGIPGEEKFIGRGVSFCATCDAALYKEKVVAVIGGGDAAVEEAIFLTKFARKVYIVHRRDQLRAAKIIQERAFANDKIEFVWSHIPVEVVGDDIVRGLKIQSRKDGSEKILEVDGIFIYIGLKPNTGFIKIPDLEVDDRGFVITDTEMRTNIPGLFAAGDVRSKLLRQVSTAVGEGATAEFAAEKYLEQTAPAG